MIGSAFSTGGASSIARFWRLADPLRSDSFQLHISERHISMWLRRLLLVGLLPNALLVNAAALPPIEPMPTVNAALLAPPDVLNGTGYTIDPSVPIAGYMGQFVLRAPAGTFNADGAEMLAIRVAELAAIGRLGQLSQTGVFADALAASALKTGAAIGQAVTNPVQTISGIPAGVGRFFQSAATTLERATENNGGGASAVTGAEDAAMDALGVNAAKRRIARQAGADPYTTNPVLAKQLDDLARAAVAGGVSLDVALAASTAGVATAISATATVSNLVWDKSPADIRTIHEERLAAMGVGADTVRAFVTNRWFTPTLSVPFVEALAQMPEAKNRAGVVTLAAGVASESEARYLRNAVAMARRVGTERDPVVALEIAGRILIVHTRAGQVVVPAPVDYIVWTEPVRAFAERRELEGARRSIHVTGLASARAREGLRETGWSLAELSKR